MWRMGIGNQDAVSVTWRQEYDNGFWDTAGEGGELALPTETVLSAVRKFDEEFIDAMDERVARLKRTGPPGSSRIDMDRLCAEQADRATRLSKRLCSVPETDWSAVRMGARQFLER